MRNLILVSALAFVMLALGCAGGSTPTMPKDTETSPEPSLGVIDLTNVTVAEYFLKDFDGKIIGYGKLARAEDGTVYQVDSRGADITIDLTALGLINCGVTYNNPAGTAGNGLPYFYKGTTMYYDINIQSFFQDNLGTTWSPATVYTEMRRAYIYGNNIVLGELMLGEPTFTWNGIIPSGLSMVEDEFYILPYQPSGNFATTVRVSSPVFFGLIEVIWFDGICGVFDP